ncbi:MAG: sigma-54-dependent Fis family transcriptional regulator [Candidatus Aminicenantes bacterium]|nr:sigma-54-dependent Fis family transcriptional regulator [Candidatus Aminicenantes bacterium]
MDEIKFPSLPILMVDDEDHLLYSFDLTLGDAGINNTISCNDSREVMKIVSEQELGIILLDLSLPFIHGTVLLEKIKGEFPDIPVIIITGNSEIETAVDCMKQGAFDYLLKPIERGRLVGSVKRAIELRELREENKSLKQRIFDPKLMQPEAFKKIISGNEKIHFLFHYMEGIARTSEPVLITGDTGVGKELFAAAFHLLSARKGRFVPVNVAGLDDQMFTDTLFGHKKGAFTDAVKERGGLIETAVGGTLFLDEIGDLSIPSQVKLLRLLQEREYYPLGQDEPNYSDALIIVATNQDLFHLKETGEFRKDLYFRLNVHNIAIPPLRDRLDDLPILVDHFLTEAAGKLGKKKPTPPPELITLLATYHFPGNIRELRSMIFDAVSTHKARVLSLDSFRNYLSKRRSMIEHANPGQEKDSSEPLIVFPSTQLPSPQQSQIMLIQEAMKRTKNNQSVAAQLLGISRQALNRRLKQLKR